MLGKQDKSATIGYWNWPKKSYMAKLWQSTEKPLQQSST